MAKSKSVTVGEIRSILRALALQINPDRRFSYPRISVKRAHWHHYNIWIPDTIPTPRNSPPGCGTKADTIQEFPDKDTRNDDGARILDVRHEADLIAGPL